MRSKIKYVLVPIQANEEKIKYLMYVSADLLKEKRNSPWISLAIKKWDNKSTPKSASSVTSNIYHPGENCKKATLQSG